MAPCPEIVQGRGIAAGKLLAVPSLMEPGHKGREKSKSDLPQWKTMENPQRSPGERQGKLFPLPTASSYCYCGQASLSHSEKNEMPEKVSPDYLSSG